MDNIPVSDDIAYAGRMTTKAIRIVRLLRREGWSIAAIARGTGIPKTTVSDVVHGRTWSGVE